MRVRVAAGRLDGIECTCAVATRGQRPSVAQRVMLFFIYVLEYV